MIDRIRNRIAFLSIAPLVCLRLGSPLNLLLHHIYIEGERERERTVTERQRDRQRDRQTERQTNREREREKFVSYGFLLLFYPICLKSSQTKSTVLIIPHR